MPSRRDKFITSPRKGQQIKHLEDLVSVIILGENHGYRMKSYGPLPLIKIQEKTLLEHQINAIKSTFPNYEILLCVGFESEKMLSFVREHFQDVNIRVVENQIYANSNCCESVRLCMNNTMNDKILILNGGIDIVPSNLKSVNLTKTNILVQHNTIDSSFDIGIIFNSRDRLENMTLGIDTEKWLEMFFITGATHLSIFRKIISDPDYKNKFLFESINAFAEKCNIGISVNNDRVVYKVDNFKSLRKNMR